MNETPAQRAATNGLQPIETAPRDRTPVLLKVKPAEALPGEYAWKIAEYAPSRECWVSGSDTFTDGLFEGWLPLPPANFAQELSIAEAARKFIEADAAWVAAHEPGNDGVLGRTHAVRCRAFEALRAAVQGENKPEAGDIVFQYSGEIYNRPIGRGICIGEAFDHLEDQFPDGEFAAEIIIRRKRITDE